MRFVCKRCGGESPTGVGYAATVEGPLPLPAAECGNAHTVRAVIGETVQCIQIGHYGEHSARAECLLIDSSSGRCYEPAVSR